MMFERDTPPPERWRNIIWAEWRPTRTNWLNTPIHEAGHAVLMEHYGLAPYKAEVRKDGSGRVCMSNHYSDPPGPEREEAIGNSLLAFISIHSSVEVEEAAIRSAIILVGGVQAELLHSGIVPEGVIRLRDSDTKHACRVLHAAFSSSTPLFWCQAQARYLLKQRWNRVLMLAGQLEREGEVLFSSQAHDSLPCMRRGPVY